MSDSLIQFPAMASGASFAGTCLMHTMIFTGFFPLPGLTKGMIRPERSEVAQVPMGRHSHKLEILQRTSSARFRMTTILQRRKALFYFPDQRRKMSAAFVPPNPNEFE